RTARWADRALQAHLPAFCAVENADRLLLLRPDFEACIVRALHLQNDKEGTALPDFRSRGVRPRSPCRSCAAATPLLLYIPYPRGAGDPRGKQAASGSRRKARQASRSPRSAARASPAPIA